MTKQTFNFNIEAKETVWYRYPVTVTAESEEQAKKILCEALEKIQELPDLHTDEVNVGYFCDQIDGSREYMTPQENNGMPTIVVMDDETCEEIYTNELISLEERE